MAEHKILEFGQQQGNPFTLQFPAMIGMRHGAWIDALVLNGTQYGGRGGLNPEQRDVSLDYIAEFRVRADDRIRHLYFKTKSGKEISGGDDSTGTDVAYQNVRILRIGGWYDPGMLSYLQIEFVQDYQESEVVERDADGIFDFETGPLEVDDYKEQVSAITNSYTYTSQQLSNMTVDISAGGDFFAKFSASTHLQSQSTDTQSIQQTAQESTKTALTVKKQIQDGHVGVLLGTITVMRDPDGNPWFYPNQAANWTNFALTQADTLVGKYDFTSGFAAQVGLSRGEKNGLRVLTRRT